MKIANKAVLCIVLLGSLLTGCGVQPRNPQQDAAIRKIAVVSLLDEDVSVVRIGLTVFNNASTRIVPNASINSEAVAVVRDRLRQTRPNWNLVDVKYDSKTLAAKLRSPSGASLRFADANLSADLKEIAKSSGVDALLVIVPEPYERLPVAGVGIGVRTFSTSSVGNVDFYSAITIRMLDHEANQIDAAGTMHQTQVSVPASSLGVGYDLATFGAPEVKERLSSTLIAQLRRGVNSCMTELRL